MSDLVDVMIEAPGWDAVPLDALAARAAEASLRHLGLEPDDWEISLLACDDARIAGLNSEFRDKPRPTNVLSWPSQERGAEAPGVRPDLPEPGFDPELGDIAISWDTCAAEAHAAGKSVEDHVTHLIVHAVLHLLGYDHIRDQDATLMEAEEVAILGNLGLDDPYSV